MASENRLRWIGGKVYFHLPHIIEREYIGGQGVFLLIIEREYIYIRIGGQGGPLWNKLSVTKGGGRH